MPPPKDPIKYKEFCDKIKIACFEGRCGNKGKKFTQEHKDKMGKAISIALKGKKRQQWVKDKIRKKMTGRFISDITKEKCRQNAIKQFKNGMPEKTKEKLRLYSGEKASMWKGGISFEEYSKEFNKSLRTKVRKRDNYKCRECNKNENTLKRKLSIHHIDYNKKNNNENNLISLCMKCHSKTNFSRVDWTRYFSNNLSNI